MADIVIVGAGPYGLSAAAHLRRIKSLDVRVLGEPMAFWERHMPKGMLLRSPYVASSLSDPDRALTLDAFQRECGRRLSVPVPLACFVQYGRWFQHKVASDLDSRKVTHVEKDPAGLRLTLEDGEHIRTRRAVIATGIGAFAHRPAVFDGWPATLVSHASEHRDLGRFRGRRVLVVGGGQSALESAALLHESGATVEVVVREQLVHWIGEWKWMRDQSVSWLFWSPSEVGPPGVSHLTERPHVYRLMPRGWQDRLAVRSIRPAGAAWLKPRLNDIRISTRCSVTAAMPVNGHVRLALNDGSNKEADHVLLATGYRVDIRRYAFLDRQLLTAIDHAHGYPKLDHGFQSSFRGLHFVGAPAAWSFGPLMRFVAGTDFASRALAEGLRRNR